MHKDISVIVPFFEAHKTIMRCLRSLESQTIGLNEFRVIIVDDGSKVPLEILDTDYDLDIQLIRHPVNKGLPSALNTALQKANSRFFVRLDSDDYVHKNFLEVLKLKFILEPSTIAAAVDYILVDDFENILSFEDSTKNPIGCGIMFRSELLNQIGYYDQRMLMAEEIEFRARVEALGPIKQITLPLYRYVRHQNNMTNDLELYSSFKEKLK